MSTSEGPAAPASGNVDQIVTFEELAADPEIAALLDFEPVPRKQIVEGGWSPEKQREFIARLAVRGSPTQACDEMAMNRTGVTKLYRSPCRGIAGTLVTFAHAKSGDKRLLRD